jgi:hypothetical protein
MVLLWPALLGLLVGLLRGGSIANLAQLKLRGTWLILVALLIQLALFPTGLFEPLIQSYQEYWHLASYACLLGFAGLNWREKAMWPMTLGLLLNFLAIAVNQGHMPVSLDAVEASGAHKTLQALRETGIHGNVMRMCAQPELENCRATYLNFLGDIFYLPKWIPMSRPFSLGDLLLGLGLLYFLQLKMRR